MSSPGVRSSPGPTPLCVSVSSLGQETKKFGEGKDVFFCFFFIAAAAGVPTGSGSSLVPQWWMRGRKVS